MVGTSQTMHLSGIRVEAGGTFATTKGGVGLSPGGETGPQPCLPPPAEQPSQGQGQRDSSSGWCFQHLINMKYPLTHSLLTTPQLGQYCIIPLTGRGNPDPVMGKRSRLRSREVAKAGARGWAHHHRSGFSLSGLVPALELQRRPWGLGRGLKRQKMSRHSFPALEFTTPFLQPFL